MAVPPLAPVKTDDPSNEEDILPDRPWIVLVWNDPINLMSYVTFVLQKLFGYSREKATRLMLDVHHKGRAIVSSGARERMEHDASQLHAYGLWASWLDESAMSMLGLPGGPQWTLELEPTTDAVLPRMRPTGAE